MADAYDIQKFNRCAEIAESNNLRVRPSGEYFEVLKKDGCMLAKIDNIECLFYFITGYDWGNSNADI